ncbi:MAG TPA: ribonuclease III [Bacteroidetes bacterium]|nr:ribonuclease III [Bacteroidota bacterium]
MFFSPNREMRQAIKNIFGFYPGNIFLYKQAFRHKSASLQHKSGSRINNERLEYLGDAVLSLVVADYLFRRFPFESEGFLTEMRSKIVSRASLNKLSEKLGLKSFMHFSHADVRQMKSVGGDAFEAFIGALYLDRGYAFAKKIIIRQILEVHFDLDQLEQAEISYKSKMIEWAQKTKSDFRFQVLNEKTIKNRKQFKVGVFIKDKMIAEAYDYTIKGAENLAAEKAWNILLKE